MPTILWLLLLTHANSYGLQAKSTSSEHALRAAVIVGILRFTEWPQPTQASKLNICLAGKPLASKHLMNLNSSLQVKGQQLHVHRVNKLSEIKDCKVLVVGEHVRKQTALKMINYANSHPIISLCDGCKKISAPKTTIRLILRKQHIHFEVDWLKAKEHGILFDSSLLELASSQRQTKS